MACSKLQHQESLKVNLRRKQFDRYGFGLYGGTETTPGFYISVVVPNGVADLHGLKVYDSIEEIDNQPLQNVTHGRVVQYVESKNSVWLTICRKNQKEVIKELELKGRCDVEKRTGLLIKEGGKEHSDKTDVLTSHPLDKRSLFNKHIVLGETVYTKDDFTTHWNYNVFKGNLVNTIVGDHGTIVKEEGPSLENIKEITQEELQSHDPMELFVPTTPYEKAKEQLDKFGMVILIGGHGTGKTFLGMQLLLHFSEREDPKDPFILHNSQEWKCCLNPKMNAIVLLDDLFGQFCYNPVRQGRGWENMFDVILGCVRQKKVYVVMTLRDNIFQNTDLQAILEHHNLFKDLASFTVDIGNLAMEEKRSIFNTHLPSFEPHESVISGNTSFPLSIRECKSIQKGECLEEYYYDKTLEIVIKDLKCVFYHDKGVLYLLLLILFSPSQKLSKTDIQITTRLQAKKKLCIGIASFCGGGVQLTANDLRKKALELIGSYILDDGFSYVFKSGIILESLVHIIFSADLNYLIEHADLVLLDKLIEIKCDKVEFRRTRTQVAFGQHECKSIAKKVQMENKKGDRKIAAGCSFVHNKQIVDELMSLLQHKTDKRLSLIETGNRRSFLYHAIESTVPPQYLIKRICQLMTMNHRSHALNCIELSCELGHWDVFKFLFRHAKPLPQTLMAKVEKKGNADVKRFLSKKK